MMKRIIASLVLGSLFTASAWAEPEQKKPDIEAFFIPKMTKATVTLCHRNAEAYTCYVLKPRTAGEGCTDNQLASIMQQAGADPLFLQEEPVINSTQQLVAHLKRKEIKNEPISGNYFYCPGSTTAGFMCLDTGRWDGMFDYGICTRSVTDVLKVPEGRPFP